MKPRVRILSRSSDETFAMGRWWGRRLGAGSIVSLNGPLGSGKTVFVKGMAGGLGLRVATSEVVSPTFVMIKEYPCRVPFYHIDLYRLDVIRGADAHAIGECLNERAVVAVEWGDRARGLYPSNFLRVDFRHAGEGKRSVRFVPQGSFKWPS